MLQSLYLPIVDASQTGDARRRAVAWAVEVGCNEDAQNQLAVVISELARNLAIHTTRGGCLLLRPLQHRPGGVEVLSLDTGPGMQDMATCLADGFSTAGTAGSGLGSVQRASALFDLHSWPRLGTALLAQLAPRSNGSGHGSVLSHLSPLAGFGCVSVPKPGYEICGDTVSVQVLDRGRVRILVADGLGHGPAAAEASQLAAQVFQKDQGSPLLSLITEMHAALRVTRGAAVAIAEVDPAQERVLYVGVGNISGVLLKRGAASVHMVSVNGTVGAVLPKITEFTYPWTSDSLLVMNSDGVKTNWSLDAYAGLLSRHPSLTAGILYRDFSRGTDDTSIATLRLPYEQRL